MRKDEGLFEIIRLASCVCVCGVVCDVHARRVYVHTSRCVHVSVSVCL